MTPAERLASEQLTADLEEAVLAGEADDTTEAAPVAETQEEAA